MISLELDTKADRELNVFDSLNDQLSDRTSLVSSSSFKKQKQDLSSLNTKIWKCVEELKPLNGLEGKIYKFVSILSPLSIDGKDNPDFFDHINECQWAAFPAIEFDPFPLKDKKIEEIASFYVNSIMENCAEFKNEFTALLKELGYIFSQNDKGFTELFIPNRIALINGLNEHRKKDTDFPNFDFQEIDGIATDEDFIATFVKNKIILSNGTEFIHDQYAHIFTVLSLAVVFKKSYSDLKKKQIDLVNLAYSAFKWSKQEQKKDLPLIQLAAFIGAYTDSMSAMQPNTAPSLITIENDLSIGSKIESIIDSTVFGFREGPWKGYFIKRFNFKSEEEFTNIGSSFIDMLLSYFQHKDQIEPSDDVTEALKVLGHYRLKISGQDIKQDKK